MKKLLLLVSMTVACLSTAQAAISVGPTGSSVYNFSATPAVTEFATHVMNGNGSTYLGTDVPGFVAAINTNAAANINRVLPTSGTINPPSDSSLGFRRNTANNYIQSRPTTAGTNAANVLMATLQNDSGGNISSFTVSYNFGLEAPNAADELKGLFVFYSLDGTPGSWQPISALTQNITVGAQSATVTPGTWASGAPLYLLWADDNSGAGGTDEAYTIDDFVILVGGGMIVTLTAPTNSVRVAPATVTVSATATGSTPPTSVSFYTNDVLFATDTTVPYSDTLVNLPAGVYSIYARAANGVDPDAFSATNIVVVRSEFLPYISGLISENFDGMGPAGIVTPQGWWVGAAATGTDQFVSVGDGSAGPSGSVHGWNYGLTGDGNRALGTAPTGGDRNTVARIQNQGSSNIVSFNIFFDAELWRTHQTNTHIEYLTNLISTDGGATWTNTVFTFQSPPDIANSPAATALDGHQPTNRVAGLGGSFTPSTPVPPGGVIYVRWQNVNDAGTDGAIAIDNFTFEATAFSPAVFFVNITSPGNGQAVSADCSGTANITVNATASFTVTNVRFSLDGGSFIDDTTAPYSANYPAVGFGSHTLTALAFNNNGSTISTSITVSVVPNSGPVINYTNVYSLGTTGLTFQIGTPVTNQFSVSDPGGSVTNITFEVNGTVHYSTNINFGQIIVNNLLLGANTFTVRATDNCGVTTSASQVVTGTAPGGVTLVLTNGALWKYNNAGAQPADDGEGDPWFSPNFDDSAWLSGYTEIGGGDAVAPPNTNPERTPINIGPGGNRFSAIYFRTTFNVANPAAFGGLTVQSLHDDGSAVYLNGTLVATFNMPDTGVPYVYADLAVDAIDDDGTLYHGSNIVNLLVAGVNTIAVEVHQNDTGSSDLSFDLMLWGGAPAGPSLTIVQTSPTTAEVSWPDTVPGGVQLYSTTDLVPPVTWSPVAGTPTQSGGRYRLTVNTSGAQRFYTLRQ